MRRIAVGVLVGACVLLQGAPAFAHEEINPSTFPTGKPVFFTLSAANEANADLVKLTVAAPAGVAFGATTKEPPGWTVNRTDQLVTWSGGAVKPDHFDQWGFEIEGADQPGTLTYKLTLSYADGSSDPVSVDISAVSAAATGGTAKTTGSNSRANAALAVGIVGVLLGLVAVAMSRRTPPLASSPATSADSAPGAKAEQDW